jgi:hypothetical protein
MCSIARPTVLEDTYIYLARAWIRTTHRPFDTLITLHEISVSLAITPCNLPHPNLAWTVHPSISQLH